MVGRRFSDEDALKTLHEIDVPLHDGLDFVSSYRKAGISDRTYHYQRKKFGGMGFSFEKTLDKLVNVYQSRSSSGMQCDGIEPLIKFQANISVVSIDILENYYLPGDLECQIDAFFEYYNNQRYHESLNKDTAADVYVGRDKAILRERKRIHKMTMEKSRWQHQKQAASSNINWTRASSFHKALMSQII